MARMPSSQHVAAEDLGTPHAPEDVEIPATQDIDDKEIRKRAAKKLAEPLVEPERNLAGFKEKANLMAFYEEKLEVTIMDSADPNPEPYVFLSVNGRGPMPYGSSWVPRNVPVKMARKYVEVLARAKTTTQRTFETTDHEGARTMGIKRTNTLRYPFSVSHDPNPRGRAWLQNLMHQRV